LPEMSVPTLRWLVRVDKLFNYLEGNGIRFDEIQGNNPLNSRNFSLNIQRKKDGWADAIEDMAKGFCDEYGKAPNETQAWVRMLTKPPMGYGIARQDEILTMPGEAPISKSEFIGRWRSYTRKSQ
jgi:hypothetical protein